MFHSISQVRYSVFAILFCVFAGVVILLVAYQQPLHSEQPLGKSSETRENIPFQRDELRTISATFRTCRTNQNVVTTFAVALQTPQDFCKMFISGGSDSINFPDEFSLFQNVEELHITDAVGVSFPDRFQELSSLGILSFENVKRVAIPDIVELLPGLRSLEIRNVQEVQFPDSFTQLTSLRELSFENVSFDAFPTSLLTLPNIQVLRCVSCGLSQIPETIVFMGTLREIDFSFNNLSSLPDTIDSLSDLETLLVFGNGISTIDASFMETQESILRLGFDDNPLSEETITLLSALAEEKESLFVSW